MAIHPKHIGEIARITAKMQDEIDAKYRRIIELGAIYVDRYVLRLPGEIEEDKLREIMELYHGTSVEWRGVGGDSVLRPLPDQ